MDADVGTLMRVVSSGSSLALARSRFREGSCFEQGEKNGPFVPYGPPKATTRRSRARVGPLSTILFSAALRAYRICSASTALPRSHCAERACQRRRSGMINANGNARFVASAALELHQSGLTSTVESMLRMTLARLLSERGRRTNWRDGHRVRLKRQQHVWQRAKRSRLRHLRLLHPCNGPRRKSLPLMSRHQNYIGRSLTYATLHWGPSRTHESRSESPR